MTSKATSTRFISPLQQTVSQPEGVSDADYCGALEHLSAARIQNVRAQHELHAASAELVDRYEQKLSALVGSDRLGQLRRESAALRSEIRRISDAQPRNAQGRALVREAVKKLAPRREAIERSSGLDPKILGSLQREFSAHIGDLIRKHRGEATPYLPNRQGEEDLGGWQFFAPPYDGAEYSWFFDCEDTRLPRGNSLSSFETGFCSFELGFSDLDTGDDTNVSAEAYAGLGVWFEMPAAGLVQASIELQCAHSLADLVHTDEYGTSRGYSNQDCRLTIQVNDSAKNETVLFEAGTNEEDYGTLIDHFRGGKPVYTPGALLTLPLFSREAYTAGTWIYVKIALEGSAYSLVNDVSFSNFIQFDWFVRRINLRSSG